MKILNLFSVILCTAALAACSSDGDTEGGGGEGGNPIVPTSSSSTTGGGGEGGGGSGGEGGGTTTSSTTQGCSGEANQSACVTCVRAAFPAGAAKAQQIGQAQCACTEDQGCFDICGTTGACVQGGSSDLAACQACMQTITNTDPCATATDAACELDADCKSFNDALQADCAALPAQ